MSFPSSKMPKIIDGRRFTNLKKKKFLGLTRKFVQEADYDNLGRFKSGGKY
jgi:hypothetical protein